MNNKNPNVDFYFNKAKQWREELDQELKIQINSVLTEHPSYGHRRIAIELKINKK